MASAELLAAASRDLADAASFLFFSDDGTVLASSFQVQAAELRPLTQCLGDRDGAMKRGMVLQGTRYEVHRHHPPLVYGRTMGGEPDDSMGAALCAVAAGPGGQPCYGAITYRMPNLSARMVPLLQAFCQQHLQQGQQGEQRQGGPGGIGAAG